MRETREARERIARALYHHLHANRYRAELGPGILARVPELLEEQTKKVVLETCEQFGFEIEPKGGAARYYLEFGPESIVETLYGVAADSRFLGTFDRREAVAKEALDFFASGHPLVEAVLLEFTDGTRGETALLEISDAGREGVGVLLVGKEGSELEIAAYDLEGQRRPEWLELFLEKGRAVGISPAAWDVPNWGAKIRELLPRLEVKGTLKALAGVRLRVGR